jgi:uncharacterized Zn finger protein
MTTGSRVADRRSTVRIDIPSGRESSAAKALRLLIEGRVRIRIVNAGKVRADVRGDSGTVHRVGYAGGTWTCSCEVPAHRPCSHRRAVWLVVARDAP